MKKNVRYNIANDIIGIHTLLSIGADGIGLVGLFDQVLASFIRLCILFGIGNHLLDIFVVEARRGSNSHRLVLVGCLVLS